MRSELALRLILPMPFTYLRISLWVKRVIDPAALPRRLANDQQPHVTCSIVEKSVGDARARGKAHAVTRLQAPEMSVNPDIRCPLNDINELLFIGLRMGPGKPAARRQALMVDAEPHELKALGKCCTECKSFIRVRIAPAVISLDLGKMRHSIRRVFSPSQTSFAFSLSLNF